MMACRRRISARRPRALLSKADRLDHTLVIAHSRLACGVGDRNDTQQRAPDQRAGCKTGGSAAQRAMVFGRWTLSDAENIQRLSPHPW